MHHISLKSYPQSFYFSQKLSLTCDFTTFPVFHPKDIYMEVQYHKRDQTFQASISCKKIANSKRYGCSARIGIARIESMEEWILILPARWRRQTERTDIASSFFITSSSYHLFISAGAPRQRARCLAVAAYFTPFKLGTAAWRHCGIAAWRGVAAVRRASYAPHHQSHLTRHFPAMRFWKDGPSQRVTHETPGSLKLLRC